MPATFSHTMDPKSTLRNNLMPGILTMARLLLRSISLVIGSPGCGQPKTDETNTAQAPSPLNGTWIVKDMYTPGKTFEDLFRRQNQARDGSTELGGETLEAVGFVSGAGRESGATATPGSGGTPAEAR